MKAILVHTTDPFVAEVVPDSAVMRHNRPWFLPDGVTAPLRVQTWHGAVISRLGMCIERRFARRYYDRTVFALHPFTAGDRVLDHTRDGALIVADAKDTGNGADPVLLDKTDGAIHAASQYYTLKTGDLVLVPDGAPSAVDPAEGNTLQFATDAAAAPLVFKIR